MHSRAARLVNHHVTCAVLCNLRVRGRRIHRRVHAARLEIDDECAVAPPATVLQAHGHVSAAQGTQAYLGKVQHEPEVRQLYCKASVVTQIGLEQQVGGLQVCSVRGQVGEFTRACRITWGTPLCDLTGDCINKHLRPHLCAPGSWSAGASAPAPRPATPCTRPAVITTHNRHGAQASRSAANPSQEPRYRNSTLGHRNPAPGARATHSGMQQHPSCALTRRSSVNGWRSGCTGPPRATTTRGNRRAVSRAASEPPSASSVTMAQCVGPAGPARQ